MCQAGKHKNEIDRPLLFFLSRDAGRDSSICPMISSIVSQLLALWWTPNLGQPVLWLCLGWVYTLIQADSLSLNTWTRIHGLYCHPAWALELGPVLLGVNEWAEKGEGVSDDNRIDPGERETELLLLFLSGSSWLQFQIFTFLTVFFSVMGIHWISASLK